MIDLRTFDASDDYEDVSEWWRLRKWPPVPLESLSNFGLMITDGDVKIAAGWLYLTTSSMAWMEWFVTNPHAPLKSRVIGLEYLVNRLLKEAYQFGANTVFTSLKSRGLIKLYAKYGFTVGDTGMTNMILKFQKDTVQ